MGIIQTPTHVAVIVRGTTVWAKRNNFSITEAYAQRFKQITEIIELQTQLEIPVLSFFILPKIQPESHVNLMEKIDSLAEFLDRLRGSELIHKNGIKLNILGSWYDLPGRIVDSIKQLLNETQDYDKYFVNFCINYDGQEEIANACKITAMKVQAGKLDADYITKEKIKEELYTSSFMPPELMIVTGEKNKLNGFLLWDSAKAAICFSNKLWPEFTPNDFIEAIECWNESK